MGVSSVTLFSAMTRPMAILIRQKEIYQAACNVLSDL